MLPPKKLYEDKSSDTLSPPVLISSSTTTTFSIKLHLILPKQDFTQQPNLHYSYFTPLTRILFNSISSSNLPLVSLASRSEGTVSHSDTIQTYIHSSHPVESPILTPRSIPIDEPSIVLPTQLYTSVYFLLLACPICHTFPYSFLHRSWHNHTHPLPCLRNDSNPILMFDTIPVTSSHTHTHITI